MGGPTQNDEVDAPRARDLVDAGDAWLLDVREAHEWDEGHASPAHHIPLSELEARQHELPEAQHILVVCRSGARSRMVTDALVHSGYSAANVTGGMQAWQMSGGVVTRPDGSPGAVH